MQDWLFITGQKVKNIESQNVIPGMILSATCKMLRAVSSLICNCLSVKSAIKCPSECPNRWSHECLTSSMCACWACKILEWISMNFSQVSGSSPFSSIFLIVLATRTLTSLARIHSVQFYICRQLIIRSFWSLFSFLKKLNSFKVLF